MTYPGLVKYFLPARMAGRSCAAPQRRAGKQAGHRRKVPSEAFHPSSIEPLGPAQDDIIFCPVHGLFSSTEVSS